MNKKASTGIIVAIIILIAIIIGAFFLFTYQSSDDSQDKTAQAQNPETDLDFIGESANLQTSDDTFASIDEAVEFLE